LSGNLLEFERDHPNTLIWGLVNRPVYSLKNHPRRTAIKTRLRERPANPDTGTQHRV
jgi:hypothetical protein